MRLRRLTAAALALAGAAAAAGCGLGPGAATGQDALLTVTRDFGAQRLERSSRRPPESETAMRQLERAARIQTRYGGRFVQAIEGLGGSARGSRRFDWFFYVNGIESPVGAAEARVHPGDRVWWDYREWTAAMRVPAVVGSWPEPFVHGSEGKAFPVRIDCLGARRDCTAVSRRLESEGAAPSVSIARARIGSETLRVLVGPWRALRSDRAAAQLERGPRHSGVFATFASAGSGFELRLLDARGRRRRSLGPGAGLVAAIRLDDQQPTWLVTGTDEKGARAAAGLLEERTLRDRYAVAAPPGERGALALPVR